MHASRSPRNNRRGSVELKKKKARPSEKSQENSL
jgi:hypothetical protein